MTTPTTERHEFQAEVKQLLDLMVHSLYSNKDVFLRELISNASDALDKLRFERLTQAELGSSKELAIELVAENGTLSIRDNGIGMTKEEVIKNIGTIAKSGTKEFLGNLKKAASKEVPPELIGQFGVGFYSAFMVADRVELLTRKAGSDEAWLWISSGDGAYTLEPGNRDEAGTTVTLHFKTEDEEQGLRSFADVAVIKEIVKRYSDFVAYPIKLGDETLNSMKAIWDRPKSDVTDREYQDFYRHISHDWSPPLATIPVKIEGTLEAYALLYVPSKAPYDLYNQEMKRGLQLYVKRIFVMDECKDLMPTYLRFVKGVVDAHDLSLNVSREILQKDRQIQTIRKQLVKKVLANLDELKRDRWDDYLSFWSELGPVVKEGLIAFDVPDKDKLLDLVISPSTADATKLTTLDAYVSRMKEGQDAIWFLNGPKDAVARSPLLENFAAKGYEVLLFSDAVDEIWLERAPAYKDKPMKSIGRGEVKLGSEDDRKKESEALEEKSREYKDLIGAFRSQLQDRVKEVRLSNRLTSSPVCIVADEHDLSPRMAKMLEQMGQKAEKVKVILELNPTHPLITKLQRIFAENKDDPRLGLYAELLLGQGHLADSGQLPDPAAFSKTLAEVMLNAV